MNPLTTSLLILQCGNKEHFGSGATKFQTALWCRMGELKNVKMNMSEDIGKNYVLDTRFRQREIGARLRASLLP